MKKIKLNGKLCLNKMTISELNNQSTIIGGGKPGPNTFKNCGSHPDCCLTLGTCTSKVCPSNPNLETCQVACPPTID